MCKRTAITQARRQARAIAKQAAAKYEQRGQRDLARQVRSALAAGTRIREERLHHNEHGQLVFPPARVIHASVAGIHTYAYI